MFAAVYVFDQQIAYGGAENVIVGLCVRSSLIEPLILHCECELRRRSIRGLHHNIAE